MRRFTMTAVAMAMVLGACVFAAMAQGPVKKQVNYTINVPHETKFGQYMLPAGRYVLYQVTETDPNQFALYRNDMKHSPIALIRTTRLDRTEAGNDGDKASLSLDIDETRGATPVLKGWRIPGEDPWEVIAVDAKDGSGLVHID